MEKDKKQAMFSTYREFEEIGLNSNDLVTLPKIIDEKIFGFGTAIDEKCQGIRGVLDLLENQKAQSQGLDISWRSEPISHYTTEDENTAVFADDVYLTIKTGEEAVEMYMRVSVILNYHNNLWKVIHWHTSKPEQVESEKDTWGIESWKQKVEELEKLVVEKTADLVEKNRELEKKSEQLEHSLLNLKSTQAQLIQQEKLASLGQLTAGIAHEIKNPLNFVNNFSDVSMEMIDEALEELANVKTQHAVSQQGAILETETILKDIKLNLRKIHEHGSRADSIVKSMLMHSRGGSGKMEPTDLNALIRDYVNLSFHGMRAGKDPINVDIQLDLYESIDKVDLVGEDFSRVILNLCNNAFDAMREKTKTDPDYKPILSISTKQIESAVEIAITDNGPGIPDEIKDKILQPFFTTKKGTAGTGLGLSITNEIVKAHGGSMKIESEIDIGSTFSIELPVV